MNGCNVIMNFVILVFVEEWHCNSARETNEGFGDFTILLQQDIYDLFVPQSNLLKEAKNLTSKV